MSRRLVGQMLVLVTVVGVAVSAAPHRRLGGSPAAVPVPPPPTVGECLIKAGPTSPTDAWVAEFGPCGEDSVGEVVAVRPAGTSDPAIVLDGSSSCRDDLLTGAGLVRDGSDFVLPGEPSDDPIAWSYSIPARAGWYGPSPSLPASTSWAACVVIPQYGSHPQSTVIDAFDGGSLPPAYGTCWESTEINAGLRRAECTRPHPAELVAMGRIGAGHTWAEVSRSCSGQAALALRRTDPTAGGQLRPRVHPVRTGDIPRDVTIICYLTAEQGELVGSLVGVGEKAIVTRWPR